MSGAAQQRTVPDRRTFPCIHVDPCVFFMYHIPTMNIVDITSKEQWDSLTSTQGEFIQSWEYGEFLKNADRDIWRVQVEDQAIQCIRQKLRLGISYVYVPRVDFSEQTLQAFTAFVKKQGYTFVRWEPYSDGGSHVSSIDIENRQPQHTWVLDLSPTEDELLAAMHSKTRYNIRLAQRKEVFVEQRKDVETFFRLNEATTQRNNFSNHNETYYRQLLGLQNTFQFVASYNGQDIATVILLQLGNTMTYLYGASSNEHRNVMAPYLSQWKALQFAKEKGCALYDFWGIASPAEEGDAQAQCFHKYCWDNTHKLSGVARFKAGFGGEVRSYPKAKDIILRPMKYKIYELIKKIV